MYRLTSHHVAAFDTAEVDVTLSRSGHRFVQQGGWLETTACLRIRP